MLKSVTMKLINNYQLLPCQHQLYQLTTYNNPNKIVPTQHNNPLTNFDSYHSLPRMKDCPQGQGKTILVSVIPAEHVPKAKHNSRYCTISILHNHTNCNILLQLCTTTPINSPILHNHTNHNLLQLWTTTPTPPSQRTLPTR